MSYCRWATDDFQCDLYVYEDVNGYWLIHVAGNRVVYHQELPEPINLTRETAEEWAARHRQIMDMLDDPSKHHREEITLPHVGETFQLDTPGETADTLVMLRDLGYRFPGEIIDELRKEQLERDHAQ